MVVPHGGETGRTLRVETVEEAVELAEQRVRAKVSEST
jgi:hypothetical protein